MKKSTAKKLKELVEFPKLTHNVEYCEYCDDEQYDYTFVEAFIYLNHVDLLRKP